MTNKTYPLKKVYALTTTWDPDGVSTDTIECVYTDKLVAHKRAEMLGAMHKDNVDFVEVFVKAYEVIETTLEQTKGNDYENS